MATMSIPTVNPFDNASVLYLITTTTTDTFSATEMFYQDEHDEENLTFFLVYVFGILLPLSLLITTGNLLVVTAVCKASSSRLAVLPKAANTLVASLAVADCLVGAVLVPVFYFGIFVESLKSDFYVCLIITSIAIVSCRISVLHLAGIALDRFLAIMYPLLYHSMMTGRRTAAVIVLTWCLATGLELIPYLGWRRPARKLEFCNLDQVLPFSYVLFMFMSTFALPLLTMTIVYTYITVVARRHVRRIVALPAVAASTCVSLKASVRQPKIYVGEMKAAITTSIVVVVFVLCWLPTYIFNFVMHNRNANRPAGSELIRAPVLEVVLYTFAFGNSAANPIIYAYRYREFRRKIRKTFTRLCRSICQGFCKKGRESRPGNAIHLEHITVDPSSVTIGARSRCVCGEQLAGQSRWQSPN